MTHAGFPPLAAGTRPAPRRWCCPYRVRSAGGALLRPRGAALQPRPPPDCHGGGGRFEHFYPGKGAPERRPAPGGASTWPGGKSPGFGSAPGEEGGPGSRGRGGGTGAGTPAGFVRGVAPLQRPCVLGIVRKAARLARSPPRRAPSLFLAHVLRGSPTLTPLLPSTPGQVQGRPCLRPRMFSNQFGTSSLILPEFRLPRVTPE